MGDTNMQDRSARLIVTGVAAALVATTTPLLAQDTPAAPRTRTLARMDPARAAQLYVSNRPEDHPQANFARDLEAKARTDSIYRARSRAVMDFQKISYKSSVDRLP